MRTREFERLVHRLDNTRVKQWSRILERRIDKIERERLAERERVREARRARTVVGRRNVAKFKKCGTRGCHCASGQQHGPYLYEITRYANGRLKSRYLGKLDTQRVPPGEPSKGNGTDEHGDTTQKSEATKNNRRRNRHDDPNA